MDSIPANADQVRENHWREIESKHEMRCLWQQIVGNRTIVVECMWFPRLTVTLMISKHYARPIPRSGSSKPWPKMDAVYVYAPIGGGTWESLDQALADLTTSDETDKR